MCPPLLRLVSHRINTSPFSVCLSASVPTVAGAHEITSLVVASLKSAGLPETSGFVRHTRKGLCREFLAELYYILPGQFESQLKCALKFAYSCMAPWP
jgi:hypothetical protein